MTYKRKYFVGIDILMQT